MSRALLHLHLGKVVYKDAFDLQKRLVQHALHGSSESPNVVLTVEHFPTFTAGQRLGPEEEEADERLRGLGADVHRTYRGGQWTFHGPGQLVVYPIVNLNRFKPMGLRDYIHTLEETVIRTCADLSLTARRTKHAGVWLGNSKVCAVGVHAGRYVTMHGFALNCNIDLKWFEHIVPCGINDKNLGVTSLSKALNSNVTVDEMIRPVITHLVSCLNATEVTAENLSPAERTVIKDILAPIVSTKL